MASDRRPLSTRLKSLAQRAGLPVEDAPPADREPAVAVPPVGVAPTSASPVAPPPPSSTTPDDEQPTGEIPAIVDPTDAATPLADAGEQPTLVADALSPSADPFASTDGPSLTPPVVPARPVEAPATPSQDTDEADDEPFSPRSTMWPQTTPTLRFEPQPEEASAASPDGAAHALEPVTDDTSSSNSPEPSAPEAETDATASGSDAHAAPAEDDVTTEQPAVGADPAPAAKAGVRGGLRRLRGGRSQTPRVSGPAVDIDAVERGEAAPVPVLEAEPTAPEPVDAPSPAPAVAPAAPYEPPTKPSFAERAALRRRAKTLRARRDAGLLELGAIVLDQRRFGDPTGGSLQRRRTDELADIDSELAAIEQVLDDDGPADTVAQLRVVRCLSCTALLGPRDRFCVQCGAPRPDDAGASPAGT